MAKTNPRGISTGVLLLNEPKRSHALDAWDFQAPFARFHVQWGEADVVPAFEGLQAYGIAQQELNLGTAMEVLAHREVLVTFSSEHVMVAAAPAAHEPGWVVVVAGRKTGPAGEGPLGAAAPGDGLVVQVLLHGRSGEVLLGMAVPVKLE
jgi:hypothetical protein